MKRIENSVAWKIGGEAGEGIMTTGLLFSKSCVRAGLYACDYTEYPSLIRGGHNMYIAAVSREPIFSHGRTVELLVALNNETIQRHIEAMTSGGAIVYDPDDKKIVITGLRSDVLMVPVPMGKIAQDLAGNKLMRNTVALGASFALLEFPLDRALELLHEVFDRKGDEVVRQNIDTLRAGYEAITKEQRQSFAWKLIPQKPRNDMFIAGNEAIAVGAIAAGCAFYAAYPMTPSSSILSYLAEHGKDFGMVVKHAEDEISVINMAIGAGHMGVRSMCGTSGGGFALMNEGYSLAGMTETPVVVALAMRPGPATGLPTWTGQGDLLWALHAGHGEFPRFALAFGDVEECFSLTAEAFNVAEEYQTPVLVITDKQLAESHQTVPLFDQSKISIRRGKFAKASDLKKEGFERYQLSTKDGVSPRSIPGQAGGIFLANSDEHTPKGYSTEDAEPVKRMMEKRLRKWQTFAKKMPQPALQGDTDAEITFVFWGSVKAAVREAINQLSKKGIRANFLQLTWLSPFPSESVLEVLQKAKRPIVVENTMTGQIAQLIRMHTGFTINEVMCKYDGRPFLPEEILEYVQK